MQKYLKRGNRVSFLTEKDVLMIPYFWQMKRIYIIAILMSLQVALIAQNSKFSIEPVFEQNIKFGNDYTLLKPQLNFYVQAKERFSFVFNLNYTNLANPGADNYKIVSEYFGFGVGGRYAFLQKAKDEISIQAVVGINSIFDAKRVPESQGEPVTQYNSMPAELNVCLVYYRKLLEQWHVGAGVGTSLYYVGSGEGMGSNILALRISTKYTF